MFIIYLVVVALQAYLIGAIPVGAIIARIKGVDINAQGSGKMGTTNVLRSVGRRAALLVLIGDVLKGVVAVYLARYIAGLDNVTAGHIEVAGYSISVTTLFSLIAAMSSIAGHVWSVYMRAFQGGWYGGRGVATSMGAVLVINPLIVLVALVVGLPTIVLSRYVSLGSIVGAATGGLALVVLVGLGQMDNLSILYILLPLFIIAAHRDNISRLLKGTERKLGERAKA